MKVAGIILWVVQIIALFSGFMYSYASGQQFITSAPSLIGYLSFGIVGTILLVAHGIKNKDKR